MRLMSSVLPAVLLLSYSAVSLATPITLTFEPWVASIGSSEYDVSGSIVYDSSSIPNCGARSEGFYDGRLLVTQGCDVSSFVLSLVLHIEDLTIEFTDLESRFSYEGFFFDGNHGDLVFGLFPYRSDPVEYFNADLYLTATGLDSLFNWQSEDPRGSAYGRLLGNGFQFLGGLGDVRFIFDSVMLDGKLVRRVPEAGALTLFALGLGVLGFCRRRNSSAQHPESLQSSRVAGE